MRYALAVTPKNYLLFACHAINFSSQITQGYRWYDYHYLDGKVHWEKIRAEAKAKAGEAEGAVEGAVDKVKDAAKAAKDKVSS